MKIAVQEVATIESPVSQEMDQERFEKAMDEFVKFVWVCSGLTDEEKQKRFIIGREFMLTELITESFDGYFDCENDKKDMAILIEEMALMTVRTLNRVSEKTRQEFKETFLDK